MINKKDLIARVFAGQDIREKPLDAALFEDGRAGMDQLWFIVRDMVARHLAEHNMPTNGVTFGFCYEPVISPSDLLAASYKPENARSGFVFDICMPIDMDHASRAVYVIDGKEPARNLYNRIEILNVKISAAISKFKRDMEQTHVNIA